MDPIGCPFAAVDPAGRSFSAADSIVCPFAAVDPVGRSFSGMTSIGHPPMIADSVERSFSIMGSVERSFPTGGSVGHRPSGSGTIIGRPVSVHGRGDGRSPSLAGGTGDEKDGGDAGDVGDAVPQAATKTAYVSREGGTTPGGAARRSGDSRRIQTSQTAAGRWGTGICGLPVRIAERMVTVASFVITHALLSSMKIEAPECAGRGDPQEAEYGSVENPLDPPRSTSKGLRRERSRQVLQARLPPDRNVN
ncbi:hypothetical protein [Streptosporangium sp. NPDC023615]|uniref:hypothetical protein n=1 Tax=Streptosporangium sp. NPDC023615 TaxID=3154794 RepID=UPI00343F4339